MGDSQTQCPNYSQHDGEIRINPNNLILATIVLEVRFSQQFSKITKKMLRLNNQHLLLETLFFSKDFFTSAYAVCAYVYVPVKTTLQKFTAFVSVPDSKSTLHQGHKSRNEEYGAQYFTDGKRVVRKTHWTTQNARNRQNSS